MSWRKGRATEAKGELQKEEGKRGDKLQKEGGNEGMSREREGQQKQEQN